MEQNDGECEDWWTQHMDAYATCIMRIYIQKGTWGRGRLYPLNRRNINLHTIFSFLTGACGGFATISEVPLMLFSPGWPSNYGNFANCMWVITAPDSTVQFNILTLDIESHSSCDYDKLVFRDGEKHLWYNIQTECATFEHLKLHLLFICLLQLQIHLMFDFSCPAIGHSLIQYILSWE